MTNDPERTAGRPTLRSVPSPSERTRKPRTRKSTSAKSGEPSKKPAAEPTHEQIARRAYEIFLTRGGGFGREREDWLLAEAELRGTPKKGRQER